MNDMKGFQFCDKERNNKTDTTKCFAIGIILCSVVIISLFVISNIKKIYNGYLLIQERINNQEFAIKKIQNEIKNIYENINIILQTNADIHKLNNITNTQMQNTYKKFDKMSQQITVINDKINKQQKCITYLDTGFVIVGFYDDKIPIIFHKSINCIGPNTLPPNNNYGYIVLENIKCTNTKSVCFYNILQHGYKYNYEDGGRMQTNQTISEVFKFGNSHKVKELQKLYNYIQDMGIKIEIPSGDKELLFSVKV